MTGPQELKVLVDLAMISGGETDMETAKITCLHTSCLAFSPLIFDLKPNFGFEQLMKACSPVWKAAERNRNIPFMLVSYLKTFFGAHDFKHDLLNKFLIRK